MARKRKTAQNPDTEVAAETPTSVSSVVEIPEAAVGPTATEPTAALAVIEPPAQSVEIPTVSQVASEEPSPNASEQPTTTSRPHWIQTVNLGRDNSGPKMRLGRSERFQQMVIQFDEKPTDETRIHLGEAGWRWRSTESQWTKQLDFSTRARGQLEAEKLFDDIARHERAERGLPGTLPSVGR